MKRISDNQQILLYIEEMNKLVKEFKAKSKVLTEKASREYFKKMDQLKSRIEQLRIRSFSDK